MKNHKTKPVPVTQNWSEERVCTSCFKNRETKQKKKGEEAGVVTVSEPEHECVCLLEGTWWDQCSGEVSSRRIQIV